MKVDTEGLGMTISRIGSDEALRRLRLLKHGPRQNWGWNPVLRERFGSYTPDDYYETCLDALVDSATEWIDVGGGATVLESNPPLARLLGQRCKRLVAVDPSSNVQKNALAHERVQDFLENYDSPRGFDLATMRMVVEHVARPPQFVAKLGQLVRAGGLVVVYTVDRWAPVTLISACTPMWIHHRAKKILWATDEEDTFPVEYRMNTRSALARLFTQAGFEEVYFERLDDCRALSNWKTTLTAELLLWKALRSIGLRYPETCLLAVYRRLA